ncbi:MULTISPECIES: metal ABC transporter substrate-binding protein [unclassified Kitasatospora]|uniref:metal ABC transporter substrate-binding protein n=1 Tax=unclassified Kitasatospora TaxID=2633591 RepID=UPI000709A0AA|nr:MULTISPECIES: metal ABC transporter substrate-binding protein [unclassified Kitasatospora]KQV05529.1 ABC transporter substrate-binding protein [Kitasatospora sp. Root107]KRB62332.1 ABC transporter substrate-binding protein [Kitasatospora sp. Root187]
MMLRRVPTSIALTATALVGALVLTACGGSSSAKGSDGKLDVVASFYPMEFLASKIGGEHVNVTDLTAAGAEPHDLELTAKQVAKVKDADLVVYLKGLQPTVDKAVAQSGSKHVVDATAASPLVDHHLPAEEGEEHKDEAAGDPHIWLDPSRYATVAKSVGAELAKADPSHAADYQTNTDRMVADLAALDQEFKAGLKDVKGKSFVTSHAAFGYLAEAYGINQIAINGVDPEAEPTPAKLAEVQRAAKEHGVTTIFFETLVSPKLAETVAKDLNLKTAVLDPLEGVKDQAKDNYFSVMRQNLANLKTAFGTTG